MSKSRRDEITQELARCLRSALDRLTGIWDDIGIVDAQRQERMDVVFLHLRNLLEEMVNEEDSLKTKLLANVESFGGELLQLSKELNLPPHEPGEGLTILQLEKELRVRVDALKKEKHDRVKKLKQLRETDQHLCDILCSTPYYIPTGSIPTADQLEALDNHIQTLLEEKNRRYNLFKNTKTSIIKLLEDLDQVPSSEFERDIVCEEEESFLLSTDNMKALKILHDELEAQQKDNFSVASELREKIKLLWDRLHISEQERSAFTTKHTGFKPKVIKSLQEEVSRCESLKLENIRMVIEETRKELSEWWDKCYFSPEQREGFKPFHSDDFTEDLLKEHEEEVERVTNFYHENEEMLQKVSRRQQLWSEFLEFERKASDPNRFFNRNCNLLKEEKARKKIQKELPRVEQEVKEQIDEWQKQTGKTFLLAGMPFMDYIQKQWEDFHSGKEIEKQQRHVAKSKQLEEEMIYGSKPITPAKRRFATGTTPGKTPTNKLRKLNDTTPRTPGSVSRIHTPGHINGPNSLFMHSPAFRTPGKSVKSALKDTNGRETPASSPTPSRRTTPVGTQTPPRWR